MRRTIDYEYYGALLKAPNAPHYWINSTIRRLQKFAEKNGTTVEKEIKLFLNRKKRTAAINKVVYDLMEETGKTEFCIRQRLYKNTPESRLHSKLDLRSLCGRKPFKHLYIKYENERMPFSAGIKKATLGRSKMSYGMIRTCRIYKGMSIQETFDKFVERWRKRNIR